MASFLATYTTPRGESKKLRLTADDLTSAKRLLRRRGILADSIVAGPSGLLPAFTAVYTDYSGKRRELRLRAQDISAARRKLRRRGHVATSIVPVISPGSGQTSAGNEGPGLFGIDYKSLFEAKPNVRDRAVFASKLAALVGSGVPIVRSLTMMASQQKKRLFRRSLEAISIEISQGGTLGSAMRRWPTVFDRLSIAMIEVGEIGGVLDETLRRLALLLEQTARLRNQIRGALTYPVVLLLSTIAVLLGMTIFIIPTFSGIYQSLDAELPVFTQALVSFSELLRSPFSIFLAGFIGIAVWLFVNFYRTPYGHRRVDAALLKLPLFGDLIEKTSTAQFCRTFSALSRAGVPILLALDIVRDAAGNIIFADAIESCSNQLQEGIPLSTALKSKKVFPDMALSMLEIGEETGEMDRMLSKVADFYEDEVATAVKALTSLLEPAMIIVVGGIVGLILVAMYLPMFSIFDKIR